MLNYRQIHMDFHTGDKVEGVGSKFDREDFINKIKLSHADSITVFAKCHHGMFYYPTKVGQMHPTLKFDLLSAQLEAAKSIGVNTNVYISAGLDQHEANRHPEWLRRGKDQSISGNSDSLLKPGFIDMCLNTGYLDKLAAEVEEVVSTFEFDTLFLDICSPRSCYCQSCIDSMLKEGVDVFDEEQTEKFFDKVFYNYTDRMREAATKHKKNIKIFHNGGNVPHYDRARANVNTHLELESLPTGGWGYDHFPISAAYSRTLGKEYLGMTGKFQSSWGDFGGYKSPDALKYENFLAIAMGAKCSVGDQIPPSGRLDYATYELIGKSYAEVEKKEPWCKGYTAISDVALLSVQAIDRKYETLDPSNVGASRILMEIQSLYDVIDTEADFTKYKVIILPDKLRLNDALAKKMNDFIKQGGKILATGKSGLKADADVFAIDLGVDYVGKNEFCPDYFRPGFELERFSSAGFAMYSGSEVVKSRGAKELGIRENPYFQKQPFKFCSHSHTPSNEENAGGAMFENDNGIYISWNMFEDYAKNATLVIKETIAYALDRLLGDRKSASAALPSQGVLTYTEKGNSRVLHLLFANITSRGEKQPMIDDIVPIYDTAVKVKVAAPVSSVTLVPEGEALDFKCEGDTLTFTVPKFRIHQMVEIK